MDNLARNIDENRPEIRQLDDAAINRIAAGEVVERPASAVKELVENAIDAKALSISIDVADGGKTLIRVTDDGCGMTARDLPLALSRHATSKLDGTDLLNIHSFGFRGEALPSLGAVGRLSITSRAQGHEGAKITVTGGQESAIAPAALGKGTCVELRDIFFATPARLKFMRTDRAEMQAVTDVVKRLAIASPHVGFTLRDVSGGKQRVVFEALAEHGDFFDASYRRLRKVLGHDFAENAFLIDAERDEFRLTGYAALPTFSVNVVECTVVGLCDDRGVPVSTPALIDHPRHQAISDHANAVSVSDGNWAINQAALSEPRCARHFSRCI